MDTPWRASRRLDRFGSRIRPAYAAARMRTLPRTLPPFARRAIPAALLALAAIAIPATARADSASADALFQEGRRLMEQKRVPEACTKFESSYQAEATLGTLLNLANCRQLAGQLATAWARWGEAEAKARQNGDDREELARERRAELVPRLPKLTIVVRNPKAGLQVFRDDAEVAPGSYGSALPVDPGQHVVQVVREGGVLDRQNIQLAEAQQIQIELDLEAIEARAPKEPPKREPVKIITITPDDYDPGAGQRTAGWVTTGFGGAALIAGFVLGGVALGEKGSADCTENALPTGAANSCAIDGADAISNAEGLATAGQWVGIAGAVVTGVGITLVLTAPDGGASELERRAERRRPIALRMEGGPDRLGARLGGSF